VPGRLVLLILAVVTLAMIGWSLAGLLNWIPARVRRWNTNSSPRYLRRVNSAGLLIGVGGLISCLSWFAGHVSLWTLAGSFIGLAGVVLLLITTGRESFRSPTAPVTVWAFNPPPGWPAPPPGWYPPVGWTAPPDWPAPPLGWQWWLPIQPNQREAAA
jgi:hypothetical protein